jgi:hypothetical protein
MKLEPHEEKSVHGVHAVYDELSVPFIIQLLQGDDIVEEQKLVSVGQVVVRVAEYDPDHAEETNAVEARNLATVVRAPELQAVVVQRAVDQERAELGAVFGRCFGGREHVLAGDYALGAQRLWCVRVLRVEVVYQRVNHVVDGRDEHHAYYGQQHHTLNRRTEINATSKARLFNSKTTNILHEKDRYAWDLVFMFAFDLVHPGRFENRHQLQGLIE